LSAPGPTITVAHLVQRHAGAWRQATHHPFLDGIREGTLADDALVRWLVQDHLFVVDLLEFQWGLTERAPAAARAVLSAGVAALEAELLWFGQLARARGLDLHANRLPAAEAYRAFLGQLAASPYQVAMVALWAIERVYLEAWQSARPGAPALRELVEHWTAPAFAEYVRGLEAAATSALAAGSGELASAAERACVEVARLGRQFWDMAIAPARASGDAADQPGSVAAGLWAQNADLAHVALQHPFVRGIEQGTLPRPIFARFVAQDAYFLESFARAYALALARAPDRDALYDFAHLLAGVLDELRIHGSYAARWDLELRSVTPADATRAYTDFLLQTAALGTVGETCAAMTPCMRLYAFLGQSLLAAGPPTARNPYSQWIQTYAAPEFEALARTLERLLDRYGDEQRARAPYRRAMALEVAFFEANLRAAE
jgi:thiaminase/transcriptional activator TenA